MNVPYEIKYRPQSKNDIVLTKDMTIRLDTIIEDGVAPHMLLSGIQGCGKTSLAYIIAKETNASLLYINASLDNDNETIRNRIIQYCTKNVIDKTKHYKIILLDEIDHPRAANLQKVMLSIIEKYGNNTRFIMTCNNKAKLNKALISRLTGFSFGFHNDEVKAMKTKFFNRMVMMCDNEGIVYEQKALAYLVEKKFPDMRKIINTINAFRLSKNLTYDGVQKQMYFDMDTYFKLLKTKDFGAIKDFIRGLSIIADEFYSQVYNNIEHSISAQHIPQALLTIYEFKKDLSFVADEFISMTAFSLKMMNFEYRS